MGYSELKTKYLVAYGGQAEHEKHFDCLKDATKFLSHSEEASGCKYRLIYERKLEKGKLIYSEMVSL